MKTDAARARYKPSAMHWIGGEGIKEFVRHPPSMATYNFLPIAAISIALYAVSWLLARNGRLQVALHRRIWNAVLLVSFVGMIVFSILNVILFEHGISVLPQAIDVNFWHVEFGIACVIVASFHALWHIPYFKQYLPKEKPKAPAVQPVQPAVSSASSPVRPASP
jgi:hypothetical protein